MTHQYSKELLNIYVLYKVALKYGLLRWRLLAHLNVDLFALGFKRLTVYDED